MNRYPATNRQARTDAHVKRVVAKHELGHYAVPSSRRRPHQLASGITVLVHWVQCRSCGLRLLPIDRVSDPADPLRLWALPGWRRWGGDYHTGLVIRRVRSATGMPQDHDHDRKRGDLTEFGEWFIPVIIECPDCGLRQKVDAEHMTGVGPLRHPRGSG